MAIVISRLASYASKSMWSDYISGASRVQFVTVAKWMIVRHGETEWNRDGRIQGRADTPLSEEGRVQAGALGAALKDVRIDRAFSSDLSRARDTAALVLGERQVKINIDGNLQELNFGRWEGQFGAELAERERDLFFAWHTGNPDFKAPGGEGVRDLVRRTEKFVSDHGADMVQGTSLIVAHGGTVRGLMHVMLGISLSIVGRFNVARASLSILEVEPEGSVLLLYNDVSHYRRQV